MNLLDQMRCSCCKRRPLVRTHHSREELETLLRTAMGEKIEQPEMQRLIDRAVELQRKREA